MTTGHDGQKYQIAIGCPGAPTMGLGPLPYVKRDVDRFVALFCNDDQGYRRVLGDAIKVGATAKSIRRHLSVWFANPERRSSDCVLLYFAGHGDTLPPSDKYYLFTRGSTIGDPTETAVSLSWLLETLTEGTGDRPQNVLLVLDTCYSGKAGGQTAAIVSQARQHGRFREGSGLWVLASADA